jgi:hypothetical protein
MLKHRPDLLSLAAAAAVLFLACGNQAQAQSAGSDTNQAIIGVTSHQSDTLGYNRQGASFFGQNSQYDGTFGAYGDGDIGALVRDTCTAHPSYC